MTKASPWNLLQYHLSIRIVGSIEILFITICAKIVVIRWIVTYSNIMDPKKVVGLAITRKDLIPYSSVLDLDYSDN